MNLENSKHQVFPMHYQGKQLSIKYFAVKACTAYYDTLPSQPLRLEKYLNVKNTMDCQINRDFNQVRQHFAFEVKCSLILDQGVSRSFGSREINL